MQGNLAGSPLPASSLFIFPAACSLLVFGPKDPPICKISNRHYSLLDFLSLNIILFETVQHDKVINSAQHLL
jgi:hypothetical protein